MKYDNLARSLAMMEDELKRAEERVKGAESKVVVIEDELQTIGENQKQLEISEEKARKREEKYQVSCDSNITGFWLVHHPQEQIKQINMRLKQAESRSEYAEMNISKLHLRIDDLGEQRSWIISFILSLFNVFFISRGWDYPREDEDQRCVRTAWRNIPRDDQQILD